jgi:hypothetical protein
MTERNPYPVTPDGRYFVVRGRLWRMSNPDLPADLRAELVRELMDARRKRDRARVDAAKRALGERGPSGGPTGRWIGIATWRRTRRMRSGLPGLRERLSIPSAAIGICDDN